TVEEIASGIRPYALAADGANVYWVDAADQKVHQAAPDGSGAKPISPALDGPMAMAVDSKDVFVGFAGNSVGLAKLPVARGTLVQTAAPYTTPSIEPLQIATDPGHVYSWGYDGEHHRTVLVSMPKTLEGNPTVVTESTTDMVLAVASDGE